MDRIIYMRILVIVLLIPLFVRAQSTVDTVSKAASVLTLKKFKAPMILISAGLLATTDNEILDKWEIHELKNNISPHFHTHIDDYLQYAPAVTVFALDGLGLKSENNFVNQVALLVKSEMLMGGTIYCLKKMSSADRPGTEVDSSFPSGHTAQAFAAATFLHREYGKKYPLISVLGYTAATGVGVLRIMNDKHWVSDVLVGAGIGILSTTVVYETHQFRWGRTRTKHLARISPLYQHGAVGFSVNVAML